MWIVFCVMLFFSCGCSVYCNCVVVNCSVYSVVSVNVFSVMKCVVVCR